MELITELLSLTPEEEILALFEDLGNLKVIDSELLKSIRQRGVSQYSSLSKKHGDDALSANIGQGSEVIEEPVTNFKAALNGLTEKIGKDGKFVAVVVKYDDDQIMIIANPFKLGRKRDYKDPQVYVVRMQGMKSAKEALKKAIGDEGDRLADGHAQTLSEPKMKKALEMIGKQASEANAKLAFMIIGPDRERIKAQGERQKSRAGRIPLPHEGELEGRKSVYNSYFTDLRADLRARLDKFKSTNVKDQYKTPEDMLKGILEKGFAQKLKFVGFTYDRHDQNNDFRSLLRGDPEREDYPHVSVTYKLNTESPEAVELKGRLQEIRDELSKQQAAAPEKKDELWEEYYKRRKEIVPPGELKIVLGLKGGSLVPTKIRMGDKETYLY